MVVELETEKFKFLGLGFEVLGLKFGFEVLGFRFSATILE